MHVLINYSAAEQGTFMFIRHNMLFYYNFRISVFSAGYLLLQSGTVLILYLQQVNVELSGSVGWSAAEPHRIRLSAGLTCRFFRWFITVTAFLPTICFIHCNHLLYSGFSLQSMNRFILHGIISWFYLTRFFTIHRDFSDLHTVTACFINFSVTKQESFTFYMP